MSDTEAPPTNPYAPPLSAAFPELFLQSDHVAVEYVDFWPRAIARIIDTLVHLVAGAAGGFLIGIAAGIYAMRVHIGLPEALAVVQPDVASRFLLGMLGTVLIQSICEGLHGSSPGKLMRGLVVLDESLRPAGMLAAFQRSIAYLFDSLFFGGGGGHMDVQVSDPAAFWRQVGSHRRRPPPERSSQQSPFRRTLRPRPGLRPDHRCGGRRDPCAPDGRRSLTRRRARNERAPARVAPGLFREAEIGGQISPCRRSSRCRSCGAP